MRAYSVLFAIVLGLASNAFSQIEFTTHIITPGAGTTDNATYVLTFDVDSDGDIDLVSSSWLDNKIAWYENDGQQNFIQHIIYTNATGASWLAAVDMDGDEDIDVLSTAMVSDRIYWYENDGAGMFTTHVVDSVANPTGWGKFSVYAYDVDGDEDMDVLSGSWDQTAVEWHENDGNQNFTTHLIGNPGQRSHVIAEDLDGDGDADFLSASQISNTVAWYENDGDENFTTHLISNSVSSARAVVAVDLDKDGDMDVAAAPAGESFIWFENDGNQSFTAHSIAQSPNCQSIYVIDVDNDGDLDVLTATFNANMVGWLENDGDENFTFHVIAITAPQTDTVWGSDVDGDGDIDVLSAALEGDQIAWYENKLIITGVETNAAFTPEKFVLHQNYPNPFNPATTIEFSLPQTSFVTLKVYNLLGEEVANLLEAHKPAGQHIVSFDASGLASGLYYYMLTAGPATGSGKAFKQSRKMLLLR